PGAAGRASAGAARGALRLRGPARRGRAATARAGARLPAALPRGVSREDEAHRQRRAGRVGMSEAAPKHVKIIAKNRRAHFDYHVESRVEAGIALTGTEVKSLREGSAQLSDSYAVGQHGELFLL